MKRSWVWHVRIYYREPMREFFSSRREPRVYEEDYSVSAASAAHAEYLARSCFGRRSLVDRDINWIRDIVRVEVNGIAW